MTPQFDLDLTQVHFQRTYGDITLYGTWFGEHRRPALVLIPTYLIGLDRYKVVPCVVPLANAYLWAKETGDPRHCARVSKMFAEHLSLTAHNAMTLMRITTIIQDNLGELLAIPPKPAETYVAADAIRTDEHGKQHHAEILDHV